MLNDVGHEQSSQELFFDVDRAKVGKQQVNRRDYNTSDIEVICHFWDL